MKKGWLGIVSLVLVLGVGTAAYAKTSSENAGNYSFAQMLPFMKQMHPAFSDQQLQDMYNTCHKSNVENTSSK